MFEYLAKAPSEAWVGLLGVVVGALLSIFGSWLSSRSNTKHLGIQLDHETKEHKDNIRRERLEELYVLLSNWLHGIVGSYIKMCVVMDGRVDYEYYLEQTTKEGRNNKIDFTRLEMIIEIYARDLLPSYQELMAARDEFSGVSSKFVAAYQAGEKNGKHFIQPYTAAYQLILKHAELLKKGVAQLATNA